MKNRPITKTEKQYLIELVRFNYFWHKNLIEAVSRSKKNAIGLEEWRRSQGDLRIEQSILEKWDVKENRNDRRTGSVRTNDSSIRTTKTGERRSPKKGVGT